MSIEDEIKKAALGMLQSYGIDAVEVLSFEEGERADGFCDTCFYEWTVVEITYLDEGGSTAVYEWSGNFGELVRELS